MKNKYTTYFDAMESGTTLTISNAQNPLALKQAGMNYIDNGGPLMFSSDWSRIIKLHTIPDRTPKL